MPIQWQSNVHRSRPHYIVWNELTHACWLQVATPLHSYHSVLVRSVLQPPIVERTRYMEQCVTQRSAHCQYRRHTHACYAFLVLVHNPDDTTFGSGLGLIWKLENTNTPRDAVPSSTQIRNSCHKRTLVSRNLGGNMVYHTLVPTKYGRELQREGEGIITTKVIIWRSINWGFHYPVDDQTLKYWLVNPTIVNIMQNINRVLMIIVYTLQVVFPMSVSSEWMISNFVRWNSKLLLRILQWRKLLYTAQDILDQSILVLCHLHWISCLVVLKFNVELVNCQEHLCSYKQQPYTGSSLCCETLNSTDKRMQGHTNALLDSTHIFDFVTVIIIIVNNFQKLILLHLWY